MPSPKPSPAEVHLPGVYKVFQTLCFSNAAFDEYGGQPPAVRLCLLQAFEEIKEGKRALYRAFEPHAFVSFACGFAIWAAASPDDRVLAIAELQEELGEDLL